MLAAAKLLKESEGELKGRVKLMFQPAEEKLAGAADMLAAGILENPKVDAALAMHLFVGAARAAVLDRSLTSRAVRPIREMRFGLP